MIYNIDMKFRNHTFSRSINMCTSLRYKSHREYFYFLKKEINIMIDRAVISLITYVGVCHEFEFWFYMVSQVVHVFVYVLFPWSA